MASIKEAGRLIKKTSLMNLFMPKGLAITPLISGPHGIGKTQIVRQAALEMGGYGDTIEGGNLKEGEISGLPFANKLADGSFQVSFHKYFIIAQIARLEKFYFEKALTGGGYLDGTLYLKETLDAGGNPTGLYETHYQTRDRSGELVKRVIPAPSHEDFTLRGEDNQFKFAENLPGEVKLRLLESGEIKPYILLIDEMNRTDDQTFKEFMNFVLNKSINGYDLPWWVNLVAAQNPSSQGSSYSTIQMDGAQSDRYLKLVVTPNSDDWSNHMIASGRDMDYVEAILGTNLLTSIDSSQRDTDKMSTSPRSWDIVINMMQVEPLIRQSKFISSMNLDTDTHEGDLRELVAGKVGDSAARAFFAQLESLEASVKASEILTGKSLAKADGKLDDKDKGHIPYAIKERLKNQKSVRARFTAISVIHYLQQNWAMWEARSTKKGYEQEISIIGQQILEFTDGLAKRDASATTVFRNLLTDTANVKVEGTNQALYIKVHKFVAASMLEDLMHEKSQIEKLTKSDF